MIDRRIAVLGWIQLVSLAAVVVLSYRLLPIAHWAQPENGIAHPDSAVRHPLVFALAAGGPLLVATGVFLVLLHTLSRHRAGLDPETPRRLLRWARALAVIAAFAAPVFVKDFWLSVAWGKLVSQFDNPYYVEVSKEFLAEIPPTDFYTRMTYGPLWALISGGVLFLAGGQQWVAAVLFKALLLIAWLLCLQCIERLLRDRSIWQQSVGLALFGWSPLAMIHGLAEGHNDIVVAALLLLWMLSWEGKCSVGGRLALAASVGIKYVTLPCFLLDAVRKDRRRWARSDWIELAFVAIGTALVLAFFVRSWSFFDPLLRHADQSYFSLRAAVAGMEKWFDHELGWLLAAIRAGFLALALGFFVRHLRRASVESFREATLAFVTAALLGVLTALWPWYLIWLLGPMALSPGHVLSRFHLGLMLLSPFSMVLRAWRPDRDPLVLFEIPAIGLFVFAALWAALAPRSWVLEQPELAVPR